MNLLAVDTSSLACSVGVEARGKRIIRHEEQAREHTRLIMPMIRDCLREARVQLPELDALVLGNGPGSFIGMRIAASVTQGLAFGAGLEVVPVSSLATVALAAGQTGDVVAVTQDAHMQQVYLGLYRILSDCQVEAIAPERLQSQTVISELRELGPAVAAGYGWLRYPALLELHRGDIIRQSEALYPNADALLALGRTSSDAGVRVAPECVRPAYLRQKVAEKPTGAKR